MDLMIAEALKVVRTTLILISVSQTSTNTSTERWNRPLYSTSLANRLSVNLNSPPLNPQPTLAFLIVIYADERTFRGVKEGWWGRWGSWGVGDNLLDRSQWGTANIQRSVRRHICGIMPFTFRILVTPLLILITLDTFNADLHDHIPTDL